jgi:acyl transferase domain-containing protein
VQNALDDAGIPIDEIPKNTGVYSGIGLMDHAVAMCNEAKAMNPYTCTGLSHCVAPNRVSFFYDINGPSYSVDTACAASLTAIHLACMALWNKECTMAITGAMNQIMSPEVFVSFNQLGVLSPTGMSCPFSADAHGYVRSEGAAAVILKPLDEALADNDHIYSVIVASALAHNGNSLSLTMPNTEAQCDTVKMTYDRFRLNMDTIDFVEAHGTGTPVGDPIEAEAIARAFTIGNPRRKEPLAVGSSKGNFGHMEFVAGMVQLFKASLMLDHRVI